MSFSTAPKKGLAMRKGAAKPQTKAVRPQGRADLRALKRSACRRQEAPNLIIYHLYGI